MYGVSESTGNYEMLFPEIWKYNLKLKLLKDEYFKTFGFLTSKK